MAPPNLWIEFKAIAGSTGDPQVQGLKPSTTTSTKQIASFMVTLHIQPNTIDFDSVTWSVAEGTPNPGDDALYVKSADLHSLNNVPMYATTPGYKTARCKLTKTVNGVETVVAQEELGCAVIGGPLTLGVYPRTEIVPLTSGVVRTLWSHDENDSAKPFYLEYFNYSHFSPKPVGAQNTQNGWATCQFQPAGTFIAWNLPSQLAPDPNIGSAGYDLDGIDIFAEGTGQDLPVTADFMVAFSDQYGDEHLGIASDDTATSFQGSAAVVNKFSAHTPASLSPGSATNVTIDSTQPRGVILGRVIPEVLGVDGKPMPLVWVQERYPNGVPPGMNWNGSTGVYWVTAQGSTLLTTGESLKTGQFVDLLGWNSNGAQVSSVSFTHSYHGATKSTILSDWPGIALGTYTATITKSPPSITHQ